MVNKMAKRTLLTLMMAAVVTTFSFASCFAAAIGGGKERIFLKENFRQVRKEQKSYNIYENMKK